MHLLLTLQCLAMHKMQIHAGAIRNCIVYASVQEDNSQALALSSYHDFWAFPLIYVSVLFCCSFIKRQHLSEREASNL